MIVSTDSLKDISAKILAAVDTSEISTITENLELVVVDNNLYVLVTNKEYYVQTRLYLGYNEEFHATVNAKLFLNLISKTTTEDIELTVTDNCLVVKGNGSYKIPLIFDGTKLLELPFIEVENPTCDMYIKGSTLNSILKYNSKELSKGVISHPVQKLYYIDEQGAITFTSGACVNSFQLDQPVKFLLSGKVVKLFKLFPDEEIHFTLGHSVLTDDKMQTRVKFESANTILTAIVPGDDNLVNAVPTKAIRDMANAVCPYQVTVNKDALLQALNRLLIFRNTASSAQPIGTFVFDPEKVTISDGSKGNSEELVYDSVDGLTGEPYKMLLYLNDLKTTLETYPDSHLTIGFGNSRSITISKANIKMVIPECGE